MFEVQARQSRNASLKSVDGGECMKLRKSLAIESRPSVE
jgi:hypothetical protein